MVLRKSLIACLTLSLSACSTTFWYTPESQQMAYQDLNHFKWDCAHAAEQMVFLKHQLAMTSPFPKDDYRRAVINDSIYGINFHCGAQTAKPAGCVYVHEDMAKGSGQATVCHDGKGLGPVERPAVSHWDPLVD